MTEVTGFESRSRKARASRSPLKLPCRVKECLSCAAKKFDVTDDDVRFGGNHKNFVAARIHAAWLLSKLNLSTTQIGAVLGGRDHSTITRYLKYGRLKYNRELSEYQFNGIDLSGEWAI